VQRPADDLSNLVVVPRAACPVAAGGGSIERDKVLGSAAAEVRIIAACQKRLARPPVITGGRLLSRFGEHSLGWVALGAAGAAIDRPRARTWLSLSVGAFAAHALAVVVKRFVRRPRPAAQAVQVLTPTPSALSFPSAHAASTTAAAVVLVDLCRPVALLAPPVMSLSRIVLGVHYPSDVAAGAALGAVVGAIARAAVLRRSSSP
jgi:membrane-associated phospholipid phosphatase